MVFDYLINYLAPTKFQNFNITTLDFGSYVFESGVRASVFLVWRGTGVNRPPGTTGYHGRLNLRGFPR